MRLQGKEALLKFVDMIGGYQMKDSGWEGVGSSSLKRQLKITLPADEIGASSGEFIAIGAACGCEFTEAEMYEERSSIYVTRWYVIP